MQSHQYQQYLSLLRRMQQGTAAGNAVKVVGTDLVDVLEEAYQQVLK